jgi:PPM family protein phosphatase
MILTATRVEEARRGRGEDRAVVLHRPECEIVIVADGAGGVTGGAAAANAVCGLAMAIESDVDWCDWLNQCDRTIAGIGLAAAIVASVASDGSIHGASVGDCEAWVFGRGGPVDLTEHQIRKPLLGSGKAVPVQFTSSLDGGTLVVASDGLWKYATLAQVVKAMTARPMESMLATLVEGVRLRSGALQDDVAVTLCERAAA